FRTVDAVARAARQVSSAMRAAFPARVLLAVVTCQARLIDFGRLDLSELANVSFRIVVDVRLPRAVTAFATLRRFRSTGVLRLRVLRALERLGLVVVTRETCVAAHVSWLFGRRRLRM